MPALFVNTRWRLPSLGHTHAQTTCTDSKERQRTGGRLDDQMAWSLASLSPGETLTDLGRCYEPARIGHRRKPDLDQATNNTEPNKKALGGFMTRM